MIDHPPIISVGMPVYNGERYLAEAIEAVLAQTETDFEFLISDNASTDGTQDICTDYAARDQRIRYVRNDRNIGAARNYNQVFDMSVGRYFRWFNADDLCSPLSHERCLAFMEAHPDVAMCYGDADIIDGDGNLTEHYMDRLQLQQDSVVDRFITFLHVVGLTNAIYGLMRRSALERTTLMGDGTYPAADVTLMAELALQGKVVKLPEALFKRRMHEQASSWDRKNIAVAQMFWRGVDTRFVMPTFKQSRALWRAVDAAPASFREKLSMKAFILRRLNWSRRALVVEAVQALRSRSFSAQ